MSNEPFIPHAIEQRRLFASTARAATVSLLRTASELGRRYDALAGQEGLSFQQYNVLRLLRGAAKPLPTMEIAARLVERAPGVTRLVDRLEEKQLIRRERGTEDRRQVFCRITPAGLDVLARLDEPMHRLDEACMAGLDEADLVKLMDLLEAVRS